MSNLQPIAPTETTRRSRQRMVWYALAAVLIVLAIAAVAAGPIMSRVEQPDYKVALSDGTIEVRDYGAVIAAEAEVEGERKKAIEAGFRLIADYIFGANTPNAKIAMTAPVEKQAKLTIAMTAPVTQQAGGSAWKVWFIMPKSWTMETLPTPTDGRVKLVPVPARRMLAIRFSGIADDTLVAAKTAELVRYAREHKTAFTGEPVLAFYNPPWTLPFFRRNEIMLELAGS